jgi:hypothetical protein
MIIYGWGEGLKDVAYAGIEKCHNCKNWAHFQVCEHSSYASLYFIKVARWNRKCVCVCKACNRGWEISDDKRDEVIRMTVNLPSEQQCLDMWTLMDHEKSRVCRHERHNGEEAVAKAVWTALADVILGLKQTYQDGHVQYVARRFVAHLQDEDRPG